MKMKDAVTWALILFSLYKISKELDSGPGLNGPVCTPNESMMTTRTAPLWVRQLAAKNDNNRFTFEAG